MDRDINDIMSSINEFQQKQMAEQHDLKQENQEKKFKTASLRIANKWSKGRIKKQITVNLIMILGIALMWVFIFFLLKKDAPVPVEFNDEFMEFENEMEFQDENIVNENGAIDISFEDN